ncbi:MAG: putative Ig domain-containing protein [Steroidobacteraceae bacterium]
MLSEAVLNARRFRQMMMVAAALAVGFLFVGQPAVAQTSSSWTTCAREGSLCAFSGTRTVRFGANNSWVSLRLAASGGGVQCSKSIFGDPAPGIRKRCQLSSTSGTTQQPPVISGTPSTSVTVGSTYRFQPTASDPNGDTLAFSIVNRPSWATFNTTNGLLTGQPTLGNVGSYANITIRVSDSTSTVSLPAFAINVAQSSSGGATVSWTPPTQNTNGTSLTNLVGYRIYYGTSSSALTQQIQVANASVSSYVLSGLGSGTYYFGVRAYNSSGAESALSNVASKTLP